MANRWHAFLWTKLNSLRRKKTHLLMDACAHAHNCTHIRAWTCALDVATHTRVCFNLSLQAWNNIRTYMKLDAIQQMIFTYPLSWKFDLIMYIKGVIEDRATLVQVMITYDSVINVQRVNPLRAKFFRGYIKHIFTFYVIPPHWYDTGGWNTSSNKTRTCPFYIVNIMAAGVLATQGARTSAVMILT